MTDQKISQLTSAAALGGTELITLVQNGANVKALLSVLSVFFNTSNVAVLGWAYAEAFAVISATRNANDVITTASIVWPDGATGTFTTDTINATFNAIDAWHATHILEAVTITLTQTAVTRNANGAVVAQPAITIS